MRNWHTHKIHLNGCVTQNSLNQFESENMIFRGKKCLDFWCDICFLFQRINVWEKKVCFGMCFFHSLHFHYLSMLTWWNCDWIERIWYINQTFRSKHIIFDLIKSEKMENMNINSNELFFFESFNFIVPTCFPTSSSVTFSNARRIREKFRLFSVYPAARKNS